MKRQKKPNKGFTLVELLIVIVIIGILAAVVIPSVSGWIEKANESGDVQTANAMTKDLISYFDSQIPDNITASDIRYALDKYDFQPKTANKGNAFWFDKSSGTIILKKAEDFVTSKSIFDVFADNYDYDYERSVEEIIPGYLYLNTAGSDLAGILASIHNIASEGDFKGIQSFFNGNNVTLPGFSKAQIAEIARHVNTFSPENTLFISDFSSFSREINSSAPGTVKRVVFADGIKTIPEYAAGRPADDGSPLLTIEGTVSIPHSVSFIEANAFINVRSIGGFRVRSMSALRLAIKDGKSLAFSQVIEDILGDSISLAKKMRGTAIADAHLFVKYANEPKEKTVVVNDTQYQVSYYPSTIAFKPQITFNSNFSEDAEKEFAAYTEGQASEILASDYRLNYRKNLDGSITAEIKMFDEYGILATGELTYTPIEDMEIDFSKGILTFANVTRNLPSDAAEYKYVVSVNGTILKSFTEDEMKKFVGVNGEWNARNDNAVTFRSENDAKAALAQIKQLAEDQGRSWVQVPTISQDGKKLTFSYTFKADTASNNSELTGNTLTNNKSGVDNTVETTYVIEQDGDVWKIKRTSKEESTNYTLTTVEYYAHDDKTSYDSLKSSFNGTSSSNTAIFEEINAYKYSKEFIDAVKGQSTANITVKLVRNEGDNTTTIISSTKSIEVNVNAMVFEEKLTDGGPNKQFYEFKDVPNSFIQGMGTDEILKLYGGKTKTYTGLSDKTFYNGIFTRNFIYIGKRDAIDLYGNTGGKTIAAGVFDADGFVDSYTSKDEIYSLDDTNSNSYKAVAEMLKGRYPNYSDDQINGLLKKAFFIRNSAESTSVTSSIFVHPQITDPYFLCVFVGDKMKLYSLFERDSNSPTREVEFSYEIIPTGNKYDMEFSYIRGTTALEGEGTQKNPYVFIKPDTNGAIGASDLFPAGTEWYNQIRFKGDSRSHYLYSYEDNSNYYLELDAGTVGQDIRKLTIYFRPDNVVFCAKYVCYIELIDAHEAEKIVTNNVSETKEYDAYYYDEEGLGLGYQDFYGTIKATGAGFNFVYMDGYNSGNTVYQTEFEIKFGTTTKKFYVIRGDIMPDGTKLSEYLENNTSFNYTFQGKISMPTVTGWNDTDWLDINKYACKGYYYKFTINGETIMYYPYMVSDINAFHKSAQHGGDAYNGKIYTNRAQCLVFSEDGEFVKVFDTGVRVTKNSSGKYDYKTVVPENGKFYIPAEAIGWGEGKSGTIAAKTTRFYFVSTNDSDPHFFQYTATGKTSKQYPNYRVIDKVTGTKDFHVVSSNELKHNLYSARIGLLDCGSYLNQGSELTIQKDVIVQPYGTDPNGKNWSAQWDGNPNYNLPEYVHLIMANGISGRYVYLNANGSKNTYWLEMYAGNTDTPLEAGHKFSDYFGTGTGKAQTLIVNVYNYGMMITYTFRVKILEESDSLYISKMNYAVLNKDDSGFRTYYVNTSNSESNDILICNERTQYISRNGYPVNIDLYGGTAKKVPTDSSVIYVGSGDFSSEEEAINSVKNGGSGWQVFDRRISYVWLSITLTKQDGKTESKNKGVYITYAEISEGLAKYNKNHKDSILAEYNKGTNTYTNAEITGWSVWRHVLGSYSKNNDGSIDYRKEATPFRMTSGEIKYLVLKVTIHREVEYMAIRLVGKAANDQTPNDEFVWIINEKWPEGKTTETFGAESNVTCYEFKFAPGEKLFDAGRSCQIMNLYTNSRIGFYPSNVQVWNSTNNEWEAYNADSWIVGDDGTYIKITVGNSIFYAHITTEEAELNTSFAAVNNFNLEKQPLKAGEGGGYNIPTYTMTRGEPLQVGFGASRIYVKNGSQYTTGNVYARYGQSGKSGSYRLYIKYGSVEDNNIDSLLGNRFSGTLPEGWTELVIPYEGEGSKNNDDREQTKLALDWKDATEATVVYCYVGYGKEWRAAVNLKLDTSENATPTVQAGIRRINNVPYYTDLKGEPPVVIIDGTDAKIKLSTSTIWYSYNGFIKSTSTFSATATKFYYETTDGTKTEIAVTDGILDLSQILTDNSGRVTIIAEHTISNITYTCEFIVQAKDVKAKITKINNKPVTEDSATVKVYKGERLFPNETITYNSTSIFVYGEKSATTYFYTNTNFKYYYSVPEGTQITTIYETDEDGNTTQTIIGYTCEIGGKTYDVIKEGNKYFYLVDMSNFVFNENGTLIVVYLDIYKTSVNIEVVETPEPVIIINNRLYLVPYRCVTDKDDNSSYEKLSANCPDMEKIGAATKTEPFEFGINQYWQSLDKETLQLNFFKDKLTLMDSSTSLGITLADGSVKNIGIKSWSAKITYNGTEYEYAKEEDNLCKGLGKHKLTLSYTENGYTYVFEFWYTFKQN